jgi:multiple sugar transport system permease protein
MSAARARRLARAGVALILAIGVIFPALYVALIAIRDPDDSLVTPPKLFTLPITFTNFQQAFDAGLARAMGNTVGVAVASTVIVLLIAVPAAYGFAFLKFRMRGFLLGMIIVSQTFVGISIVLPILTSIEHLGLYDTYAGLVLVYVATTLPFSIWLLTSYFQSLPPELESAARVDGCNRWQALRIVLLPIALPGIGAVAVFVAIAVWSEFTFASLLMTSQDHRLANVALASLAGQYKNNLGSIAAGTVVVMIPPILLFMAVRRFFVSGLAAGAVKG